MRFVTNKGSLRSLWTLGQSALGLAGSCLCNKTGSDINTICEKLCWLWRCWKIWPIRKVSVAKEKKEWLYEGWCLSALSPSCHAVFNGTALQDNEWKFFQHPWCPRFHRDLKEPLFVRNLTFFCSFKIYSNIMPCSCWVMSTWHALLYTKPNLSVWWFSMPKGFRIGQHIRQIPGMSKLKGTFGHTVHVMISS